MTDVQIKILYSKRLQDLLCLNIIHNSSAFRLKVPRTENARPQIGDKYCSCSYLLGSMWPRMLSNTKIQRKYKNKEISSLFQALCQWRIKKADGRQVGSGREKGDIPVGARSLFRSSSLTESLEEAKKFPFVSVNVWPKNHVLKTDRGSLETVRLTVIIRLV